MKDKIKGKQSKIKKDKSNIEKRVNVRSKESDIDCGCVVRFFLVINGSGVRGEVIKGRDIQGM